MGAGDLLMSFLGVVIISMGFRIYQQRETMKRHAPEILGATLLSSLFSFFSTAMAAKALGLQAGAQPRRCARADCPRRAGARARKCSHGGWWIGPGS